MNCKKIEERKTILLVERNAAAARAAAGKVEALGYKVVPARPGAAAVETAVNGVDLVLVGLGGAGAAETARLVLEKRTVPVVFLVKAGETESVDEFQDLDGCVFAARDSGSLALRSTLETAMELFEARKKTAGLEKRQRKLEAEAVRNAARLKNLEKALLELEDMFRIITQEAGDFIALTDDKGVITLASASAKSVFGYERDEMVGRVFLEFLDEQLAAEALRAFGETMMRDTKVVDAQIPIRRKDGSAFIGEVNGSRFRSGEFSGTLVIIRDVTERKLADDKIKSLLSEKEILLREVNHRIKNNMNTINSLLSLQAGTMTEPAAVTALEDAGRRVRSMMLLYDKLYRSTDFIELPARDYLSPLIDEIVDNFPAGFPLTVEKQVDDFILDTRTLQPLGIIINELVSNCMKYAFAGLERGKIVITAALRNGRVVVTVSDDGHGLPEDCDSEASKGFGLTLVKMLVEQMRGTVEIVRGEGTKVVLDFEP